VVLLTTSLFTMLPLIKLHLLSTMTAIHTDQLVKTYRELLQSCKESQNYTKKLISDTVSSFIDRQSIYKFYRIEK